MGVVVVWPLWGAGKGYLGVGGLGAAQALGKGSKASGGEREAEAGRQPAGFISLPY